MDIYYGRILGEKRIYEYEKIYGGEERRIEFRIPESPESKLTINKTHYIGIEVDSNYSGGKEGEIEELYEWNNQLRPPKAVGPDIVVDNLNISTSGHNITVCATIKNEGNLSASNFTVRLYLNSSAGNETANETIERLPPGDERNVNFSMPLIPNHVYNVTIVADPEGRVEEFNENNNEKSEVIGPDIEIVYRSPEEPMINVTPAYPVIGLTHNKINVIIRNKGKLAAEKFNISFMFNFTYLNAANEVAHANETVL